jgi:putative tryptophan/tyrosine transport system substrate-binding protein
VRRREFIAGLGGAVAWPVVTRAQQRAQPVIAFVNNASFDGWADRLRAFGGGLNGTGFAEGRNVAIEYHQADGDSDRLSALIADLVRRRVSVMVTNGNATLASKAATATIPIVFTAGADPVEMGMVASLNRPGGNLTGVVALSDSLGPKRLELLHELAPAATDFGVLVNPGNRSNESQLRDLHTAARTLGVQLHVLNAYSQHDLGTIFEGLVELHVGGLVIATAPLFNNSSSQLGPLAIQYAVPTVYQYRDFTAAGGLMSLGADPSEIYHWLGIYTGRILNGERPSELPIYQATKIEVIINLKTARTLGLAVPQSILLRADEVIE